MQYRSHRYKTEFPVKLRTSTGQQTGEIVDVNNTGAQIKGLRDLRRGDKVQVEILYLRAEAVVKWTSNGNIGVNFRPQITDDQVDTLRYRRDGRMGTRQGSVGFVEMT
jgi:hypothetical protein